ncbi:glycosyl hydrolase [Mucidula mucida]|nr:glycosyl hydrolase [Mucidula mucida]
MSAARRSMSLSSWTLPVFILSDRRGLVYLAEQCVPPMTRPPHDRPVRSLNAKFSCISVLFALQACVHSLINPILPGWNPDPTIVRVGKDFFIATSTFETWPGNPIYHSRNLVDWELIGHALNRPSQLALFGTPFNGGGSATYGLDSAANLELFHGTAFLAELKLFPRSFYITTTDIFSNSWSDPIYVDSLGYDPDLFWDTNGDVYYTWAGINNAVENIYGIYQNKIDIATGNSLTPAELIFNGTLPVTAAVRPEGPHVYLINGTYYLLIAEGGTGVTHRATIQRGPSPSGPWENNPKNPILYNGANLSLPVQNTGHSDLVELEDGTWFGTALAVRPQAGSQLGRETYLFPVTWEDGWPVFNGGEPLTEHLEGVLEDVDPVKTYDSDFSDVSELDASFIYLRTPYKKFHTLADRPGYLRILGNSYAPGDRDSPAMLLRNRRLEFSPSRFDRGGITVYVNEARHNDIGITSDGGKRYIVTRTLTRAKQVGYAEGASDFEYTASFNSSTIGPTFIGASFGAYNTGHGRPTLVPADFKYWKQS